MAEFHGLTKTQVIIIAVNRLARDLDAGSGEADKDIRRLKKSPESWNRMIIGMKVKPVIWLKIPLQFQ